MAEIYLVRHGQASFGQDNYDQLSALGEQQSVWLGEYFAARGLSFDRWVIGAQVRHRQTAECIAQGMQTTFGAEQHPGLNEYDFQGLFKALGDEHQSLIPPAGSEKKAYFLALRSVLALWQADGIPNPPESWADFYQRVRTAGAFISQPGARRVLVVSSGGPISTLTGQVLQSPLSVGVELNLQIRNASFSQYFFNHDGLRLASFNNIPHLDQPERLHAITYG